MLVLENAGTEISGIARYLECLGCGCIPIKFK